MSFWQIWLVAFCVIVAIVALASWGLLKVHDIAEKFGLDGMKVVELFFGE